MYALAMKVLRTHFSTTLHDLKQPHTIDSKIEFLRPPVPGNLSCTIEDAKIGKQFTVTHFTITQAGKKVMIGHATNGDLLRSRPEAVEILLPLQPAPPSIDFQQVYEGTDRNWILYRRRYSPEAVIKSWTYVDKVLPINGTSDLRYSDSWARPANLKARFTTDWLGYLADHFTRMGANYVEGDTYSNAGLVKVGMRQRDEGWYHRQWDAKFDQTYGSSGFEGTYRWPTMNMSLEIKKVLPEEGVEALFIRAEAKMVKNGLTSTEVVLRDINMDVIAVSHQIGLMVPNLERSLVKETTNPVHKTEASKL